MDTRTSGVRGTRESESMRDSTKGQGTVRDMSGAAQPSNLAEFNPGSFGGCTRETGKDKATRLQVCCLKNCT